MMANQINESEQRGQTEVLQMLKQSTETLTEALNLGLENNLPDLLCQVCLELLECHRQNEPAASGQYLALLQSCMCCTEMSRVLHSACWNSDQSQVAELLGLQRSLEVLPRNRRRSILSAINRTLPTISEAYQQLSISPNHLKFLGEMPSNLKILLLQHGADGSVLYGGFYEKPQAIDGSKGKSMQTAGGLVCSKVARAQVHPSDLLRLQNQAQAFTQVATQVLRKESFWHKNAVHTEQCRQPEPFKDQTLGTQFQALVKEMEDYLHPILSQFDFSCFGTFHWMMSISEEAKPTDEEEKGAKDKALPRSQENQEVCLVVLADRVLLELPLEALAVLQGNSLSSVSRDLSLQVYHSRLQKLKSVESNNTKETKPGKAAKGKEDKGKSIKGAPVNKNVPANTVDIQKFKYAFNLHTENEKSDWKRPAETFMKTLDMHSEFTALWEGIKGSEQSCSFEDLEHLMVNCSSFIFYGSDHFLSHISPARLSALNLRECRMAILFDLIPSDISIWHQSKRVVPMRKTQLALKTPLDCVYLLTLCGVNSVMLNQWPCSAMANVSNLDTIMENLLKRRLTSGQTVHSSRRKGVEKRKSSTSIEKEAECAADENAVPCSFFNFIIYGLPHLVVE